MKMKENTYTAMLQQLRVFIEDEYDIIANLSNAAALLYMSLSEINWAGFYLYKEQQLVLGPFQGKPACIRIPIGKGVCGSAAHDKKVYRIPDVHKFPGHIACDGESRSEIVIPMLLHGQLFGVLDIDSPILHRFDETDELYLKEFSNILSQHITSSKAAL